MPSFARFLTRRQLYPAPGPHDPAVVRGPWVCAEASQWPEPTRDRFLEADALACSLRVALDRTAPALAKAAAAFVEARGWEQLGFARIEDHARERIGRSGRWLKDMAALGRALRDLPGLASALRGAGSLPHLGRVSCLLIARVATKASLAAWIELARRVTVRGLRNAVRGARAAGSDFPLENPVPISVDTDPEISDDSDDVLVRLEVPAPVAAAFDEALDLFRAIEGHESTVRSFVEALVAEAVSHGDSPDLACDADIRELRHAVSCATVENALARSTGIWAHLPQHDMEAEAGVSLVRLADLCARAGEGDAEDLDARIRELIRLEDEIEWRLGELLAKMADGGAWSRLHFDGAGHYAEQRLGLSRTAMRDRVRVARLLRRLPLLSEAYHRGELPLETTRHIVRILNGHEADAETQRRWIARGREATVKRIRDEARALMRHRVEGPGGPATQPLDDAAWHASIRRRAGMARERVARYGAMAAARRVADVFLALRLPEPLARDLMAAIDAARRRLSQLAASVPWDVPWPEPDPAGSLMAAREFDISCRPSPAWVGLLALLEEFVQTWDLGARRRAEAIYERDGYRCAAPGCTSRRNLEDHHVLYRSRGGSNHAANRICLCRFHHQRGEHGGLASCHGRAPLGIIWRMGRGRRPGRYRNELRR